MASKKRLIDANELWQKTFVCEEPGDFRKAIEQAPTVDAVEVVRCKDCKHWDKCKKFCKWHGVSCYTNGCFPENGFCSYGERREGE